jgi:hypothetical protein
MALNSVEPVFKVMELFVVELKLVCEFLIPALNAKRSEMYQPVFEKAEKAVKAVAKEKGYAYVFDVSQPGVVYFDGGDDIIEVVKAKLAAATAAAAAPAPVAPAAAPAKAPAAPAKKK